jgi:RimJ/RimL family protein N-acetyltransferase
MDRHEIWPLSDLCVRTPRLTLRPVEGEVAFALADLAAEGVHDPAVMPFFEPWTDQPEPELQRGVIRYNLRTLAEMRPGSWRLPLAVFCNGELTGMQEMKTRDFTLTRQFETGSWLGRRFHGRGIGKEMRAAVLHLGFAGFGACRAHTDAYADNAASLGITRSLGYEPNGRAWGKRRGELAEYHLFTMDRAHWETIRRDDITIEGLGPGLLGFLGLA